MSSLADGVARHPALAPLVDSLDVYYPRLADWVRLVGMKEQPSDY